MICKICGKELQSGDRFCSRCGSKVEEEKENFFEEVVFNPPFREEQKTEILEKEVGLDEPPRKKSLFDTIDFKWDISGYPSSNENERKPVEETVFDWTSINSKGLGTKEEPKKEFSLEEKEVIENITRMEEGMPAPEKEYEFEEDNQSQDAEPVPVAGEEPETLAPAVEEPKEPVFSGFIEREMPKGNGISTEEFLESLKNHVPRAEREATLEEEDDESRGPKKLSEVRDRKGLAAFFKNAFLESEAEETELEEPEMPQAPVEAKAPEIVVEPAVVEPPKALEFVGVSHGTRTMEVCAFEEEPAEPIEEKEPEKQEINQFLPEDKQESGDYNPTADATRIVDKFYTFNKKNVEFQQLLDQEYERIRGDKPLEQIKEEVRQSNEAASQLAKEILEMKEETQAAKAGRPSWDEIFDETEEEPKKKKSKGGKVLGVIILILVLVLGGSYAVKTFLPDTGAADFVNQMYDKARGLISEAPTEDEETVQTYIDHLNGNAPGIEAVEYKHSLAIDLNKNYGVKIDSDCEEFINSTFSDQKGNKTTFGDMITESIVENYSSKAKSTGEDLEYLYIGDYLSSSEGFYAIAEYKVSGQEESNQELLYLTLRRDKLIVKSITKI